MLSRFAIVSLVFCLLQTVVSAASPELNELLVGDWVLKTSEQAGHESKTKTAIRELRFTNESMTVKNAYNKTFESKYTIDKDGVSYTINLYRQYGQYQDKLIPSRLSIDNDNLVIMLPAFDFLPELRPKSLVSVEHPAWRVLYLTRRPLPEEINAVE